MPLFTVAEASQLLEPPVQPFTLRRLIAALGIRAAGTRSTGHVGHPMNTYHWHDLAALHAAIMPWLAPSASNDVRFPQATAMPETET